MKQLTVDLGERSYDILIRRGLLAEAGERCREVLPRARRLFLVTDSTVGPLYAGETVESLQRAGFQVKLHTVPAGESSKCPQKLLELWNAMMDFGLTRTDGVVALGGGVVGDLAGFAASTALRGVDFVQIPTTLLAQVDSSVGGKVAIDLPAGKNLAGAFWQPRLVLMDPEVLRTLPDATFADGMAEVIKYGCIRDEGFFRFLCARPSREAVMAAIETVLFTCCDLKRQVVEADERDGGVRMILNFGHTLGHAFELAGHYETWTHGQAVAAGMCAVLPLSWELGMDRDEAGLAELTALLTAFGLPTRIDCPWEAITGAIGLDKKSEGDSIRLIFLKRMGEAVPVKLEKQRVLDCLRRSNGR